MLTYMAPSMTSRMVLLGILAAGLGASSCARRSAERLCEQAREVKTVSALVKSLGLPGRRAFGDRPMEWWGYDGRDGVCIVPVAGNLVAEAGFVDSKYKQAK